MRVLRSWKLPEVVLVFDPAVGRVQAKGTGVGHLAGALAHGAGGAPGSSSGAGRLRRRSPGARSGVRLIDPILDRRGHAEGSCCGCWFGASCRSDEPEREE